MLTFKENMLLENTTYSDYEQSIDQLISLYNNELTESKLTKLTGAFKKVFELLKIELERIQDATQISMLELLKAVKSMSIFNILKAFGFSVKTILSSLSQATNLLRKGFDKVLLSMHNEKVVEKVQSGAMTVDEVLAKYPLLKRLTGKVIGAFLIWGWFNMAFLGAYKTDFDVSDWFKSLSGNFSVADIFASQNGAAFLSLLAIGISTGGVMSVAWLGDSSLNLTLALLYVGSSKNTQSYIGTKLKEIILSTKFK